MLLTPTRLAPHLWRLDPGCSNRAVNCFPNPPWATGLANHSPSMRVQQGLSISSSIPSSKPWWSKHPVIHNFQKTNHQTPTLKQPHTPCAQERGGGSEAWSRLCSGFTAMCVSKLAVATMFNDLAGLTGGATQSEVPAAKRQKLRSYDC